MRKGGGLANLSGEVLLAGLYELWWCRFSDSVPDGMIDTIEGAIRERGLWEAAVRGYIEPQFAASRENIDGLYQFMRSKDDPHLATQLAAEWLERFPRMAGASETELIDRLTASNKLDALQRIAAVRRAERLEDEERRRNWQAVEFLVDFDRARAKLDVPGPPEPALLWHMRARLGGNDGDGFRVDLSVDQLAWLAVNFRQVFPMVGSPMSSMGNSNPWDASRYILSLIARIGDTTTVQAMAALAALRDAPEDGYTTAIKRIAAEQRRKLSEEVFRPVKLDALTAVGADTAPTAAADLQALLLEEFEVLAKRLALGGDDANPVAGFYRAPYTKAKGENDCRDHFLTLLRPSLPEGIRAEREASAGGKKASDFAVTDGGRIRLPVEVKGQWHTDLWHAADSQLDRLYTPDWQADRRGVYLVLWFGVIDKPLHVPKGRTRPTSPEDLRAALVHESPAAQRGEIAIVVLDLARDS